MDIEKEVEKMFKKMMREYNFHRYSIEMQEVEELLNRICELVTGMRNEKIKELEEKLEGKTIILKGEVEDD